MSNQLFSFFSLLILCSSSFSSSSFSARCIRRALSISFRAALYFSYSATAGLLLRTWYILLVFSGCVPLPAVFLFIDSTNPLSFFFGFAFGFFSLNPFGFFAFGFSFFFLQIIYEVELVAFAGVYFEAVFLAFCQQPDQCILCTVFRNLNTTCQCDVTAFCNADFSILVICLKAPSMLGMLHAPPVRMSPASNLSP